ncbi:glycosyltransferase family 4 protein [bacterium]|nr:glycosyltransferase family 4 protein [bacterium]
MNLALIFTRKVTLKNWIDTGILSRENFLYETMIQDGFCKKIYWFTYGVEDHQYQDQLCSGIEVVSMPRLFQSKLGIYLYSILLPFIHYRKLLSVQMMKTNQMEGSWTAVLVKFLFNCKLYVRTGYTWSQLLEDSCKGSKLHKFSQAVESFAYRFCDLASVSSYHNQNYLQKTYSYQFNNLFVLGNFIDTSQFRITKQIDQRCKDRLLFIGRLNQEKNLKPLLESIARLGLGLDLYGAGDQELELKEYAKTLSDSIIFHGLVANEKLVEIYNSHKYYILCSHAEGMPKTLIEAMSCGCICIGTDVLGINELIRDHETGFLAKKTNEDGISQAIQKALTYQNSVNMSQKSSDYIQENFSLDAIYEMEKSKIVECLS